MAEVEAHDADGIVLDQPCRRRRRHQTSRQDERRSPRQDPTHGRRRTSGMRPLLFIVLAVATLLVVVPPACAWRQYTHKARGFSLEVPEGWQLRLPSRDFVDPSFCAELRSPADHRGGPVRFHRSAVARRGVEIRVVQLLTGRGPANARKPFRLRTMAPPGAVEWTRGGFYSFRERSRSIYVGVLIGADVGPRTRRTVERISQQPPHPPAPRPLPRIATLDPR